MHRSSLIALVGLLRRSRTAPRGNPCAAAFTLVELLVVVAIVTLLVSILLPALGTARERARRVQCASNLRQIGAAWLMYLDQEANGVFPLWWRNLHWFYGGKVEAYAGGNTLNPRPLNRYLGADPSGNLTAAIFLCPSDHGVEAPASADAAGKRTYDYFGNSYPVNGTLLSLPNTRVPPVRLAAIRLPLQMVILAGDHQSYWSPTSLGLKALWHDREGLSMNLVFLDAHAEFIRFERNVEQTGHYSFAIDWIKPPER